MGSKNKDIDAIFKVNWKKQKPKKFQEFFSGDGMKAIDEIYDLVKGGEGSKGGNIIGHTRSGKPIYASKQPGHHKDFTADDHHDAAAAAHAFRQKNTRRGSKESIALQKRSQNHLNLAGKEASPSELLSHAEKHGLSVSAKEKQAGLNKQRSEGETARRELASQKMEAKSFGGTMKMNPDQLLKSMGISTEAPALIQEAKGTDEMVHKSLEDKQVLDSTRTGLVPSAAENLKKSLEHSVIKSDPQSQIDLAKAGGEGSKGGKIIGHTKGGKPIYDSHGHAAHANFSAQDHKDAMKVHEKLEHAQLSPKPGSSNVLTTTPETEAAWQHHSDQGNEHYKSYESMRKKPKAPKGLGDVPSKAHLKEMSYKEHHDAKELHSTLAAGHRAKGNNEEADKHEKIADLHGHHKALHNLQSKLNSPYASTKLRQYTREDIRNVKGRLSELHKKSEELHDELFKSYGEENLKNTHGEQFHSDAVKPDTEIEDGDMEHRGDEKDPNTKQKKAWYSIDNNGRIVFSGRKSLSQEELFLKAQDEDEEKKEGKKHEKAESAEFEAGEEEEEREDKAEDKMEGKSDRSPLGFLKSYVLKKSLEKACSPKMKKKKESAVNNLVKYLKPPKAGSKMGKQPKDEVEKQQEKAQAEDLGVKSQDASKPGAQVPKANYWNPDLNHPARKAEIHLSELMKGGPGSGRKGSKTKHPFSMIDKTGNLAFHRHDTGEKIGNYQGPYHPNGDTKQTMHTWNEGGNRQIGSKPPQKQIHGGYSKSFIKSSGPGGMTFDFGALTGNPMADNATKLLNEQGDPTQMRNAVDQRVEYDRTLNLFVRKGEAGFEKARGESSTASNHDAWGNQLNTPMDEQVKKAFKEGALDDKPTPINNNFNNVELTLGDKTIKATSETDQALINMMKAEQAAITEGGGLVADCSAGGKKGVCVDTSTGEIVE